MNKITILILSNFMIGCDQPSGATHGSNEQAFSVTTQSTMEDPFTLADAERILGQSAKLTDSTSAIKNNCRSYNCTYTADTKDPETSRKIAVYFMHEEYQDTSSATRSYASIRSANESHGIEILDDLGDEAYFHTDNENFYFILARKEAKMIRIKVNKITNETSLDEFYKVTEQIVSTL